MLKEVCVDDAAPWKQRFRTAVILSTQLARGAPTHGLVVTNTSGVHQLYAWHVRTGELNPLTNRPDGVLFGILSPDGRYVYYLDDQQGNEIGHFVRVPFEGGMPEDVTPDMPPYSPLGLSVSQAGNLIGFALADAGGSHLYCIDVGSESILGTPRMLHQSKKLAFGPDLSHSGEIAVIASAKRTGKPLFSLLAFDTAGGEKLGELWDGPESSKESSCIVPNRSDMRTSCKTC